ncbi:MAG TPA: sulfite exporter TauE/SafE family protein [Bacteroidetes bacterium]|nr:sulfite exporter TauE/SafE family protein [Bacteroidota bacterium]HIL56906.1 sulfite exporter TauE/SafE family protein [Rhodothermales bacterium]
MSVTALVSSFLFGLLGSGHCAGMCGPIVLAAAQRHRSAAELQAHQAVYHIGKALSYAALGALAGALAGLAGTGLGAILDGGQKVLGIVLGALLIGLGIVLLLGKRLPEGGGWAFKVPVVGGLFQRLIRERSLAASLGLGVLNGFLPCGLVYAALAVAATTGSAWEGALTMAAFGFGTGPALVLIGTLGYAAKPAWRSRMQRAAGLLLLLAGLPTLLRATPLWPAIMRAVMGH